MLRGLEALKDIVRLEPPKISMSEGQALFEYMIAKDADVIRLRSRVQFKKAVYTPEEYNELREFFSYIVKKHAEDIVLKKTK